MLLMKISHLHQPALKHTSGYINRGLRKSYSLTTRKELHTFAGDARMVELVDTTDLKSVDLSFRVQVPLGYDY